MKDQTTMVNVFNGFAQKMQQYDPDWAAELRKEAIEIQSGTHPRQKKMNSFISSMRSIDLSSPEAFQRDFENVLSSIQKQEQDLIKNTWPRNVDEGLQSVSHTISVFHNHWNNFAETVGMKEYVTLSILENS